MNINMNDYLNSKDFSVEDLDKLLKNKNLSSESIERINTHKENLIQHIDKEKADAEQTEIDYWENHVEVSVSSENRPTASA